MNSGIEDSLIHLLVQRLAARADAAAMVDWATAALVAGEDTPSLVILAGLDRSSSVFEVSRWLDKALAELKIPSLPPESLRRAFVGSVSRALLARTVTAEDALDLIHQHVVGPLGHPAELAAWCYVWEGLGPKDFSTLSPEGVDREARHLANQWASHAGVSTQAETSGIDGA